jgi:hypothetical protein
MAVFALLVVAFQLSLVAKGTKLSEAILGVLFLLVNLGLDGRITTSIEAADPFSTQPSGPRPVGCFSVRRPPDSLDPYDTDMGTSLAL